MNLGLMIYLFGVIYPLKVVLFITSGVILVIVLIAMAIIDCSFELEVTDYHKQFKKFIIGALILPIICIFIPSSKTLAAMYLIPKISNNEQLKGIPSKVLALLNAKLDNWVEDLVHTKEAGNE